MKHKKNKLAYSMLVVQLRQSLGLTQLKFANLVYMPQTMIVRIRNGNTNFTLKTLECVSERSGRKLVMCFN